MRIGRAMQRRWLVALELYYTSSPRGLRPGTSGLCTVATTRSMSPALVSRLETLCGYRPPSDGTPQDRWPVALSHWVIDIGGVERHVLASVRPVAPDHTMRSNTLAHFAVLHNSELDAAGPAWMLAQPETSATSWSGEPRTIDAERAMPRGGPASARKCVAWQRLAGDAGWAGVLANAAVLDPSRPATVICPHGAPALELIAEAMALVPPAQRWSVTFTTYFTQPVAGLRCTWRFCLDGTSAATAARQAGGLVVDLCAPQPCTRTGAFIDAARTGRAPELGLPADAAAASPRRARAQDAAPIAVDADGPSPASRAARAMAALRAPVGIEEPEPTPSRGRTVLAVAVVAAVVLLAAVAVMAVLMRTMGQRTAGIEAELQSVRAELEQGRGDAERVAELDATVANLEERLKQAQAASTAAEERARAAESKSATLQAEIDAKLPAAQSAPAAPAAPPQDAAAPSAADVQQPSPAAAAQPLRARAANPGRGTRRDEVTWLSSVRAPGMAAVQDTPVQIAWPEASSAGIQSVALSASDALRSAGFEVTDGHTLSIRDGGGAVPLGSIGIGDGTPVWTWRRDERNRARPLLEARGVRLPGDVDVLMGQLEIEARLADGSVRKGVPASRRVEAWQIDPSSSSSMRVPVAALLGSTLTLEAAGQSVELAEGSKATLPLSGSATLHAQLAAGKGQVRELKLTWMPEGDSARLAECMAAMGEREAQAAAADVRWRAASDWASGKRVPRAAPGDVSEDERFSQWKDATAAAIVDGRDRSQFLAKPKAELVKQYVDALWDARKASEESLGSERERCAELVKAVAPSLQGLSAVVRAGADGPEALAITVRPQLSPKALELAGVGEPVTGGPR